MADVGSVLVHVRRHGVAQQVARAHLAEFGGLDVLPHRPRQMIAVEGFAFGGQEHRQIVGVERELGPHLRMGAGLAYTSICNPQIKKVAIVTITATNAVIR